MSFLVSQRRWETACCNSQAGRQAGRHAGREPVHTRRPRSSASQRAQPPQSCPRSGPLPKTGSRSTVTSRDGGEPHPERFFSGRPPIFHSGQRSQSSLQMVRHMSRWHFAKLCLFLFRRRQETSRVVTSFGKTSVLRAHLLNVYGTCPRLLMTEIAEDQSRLNTVAPDDTERLRCGFMCVRDQDR